jgi:glycolate oxidase FAD binding subunit
MSWTADTITIDGFGPMPVVRPATVVDVGEVVRRCAADGQAVYPVGGGTMLDYGRPPTKPGVAVATGALDQVIDFPARDMTITVQSGITIARLTEVTRAQGLQLPIDVPEPERATLGGAIACNVSGPRRYGYGTFRDYVLGITVVTDHGEEARAGGRVVKNVAGYDLMKLHTGALGTLGIITQVTLKLRPLPEAWGAFYFRDPPDRLAEILGQVRGSRTHPAAVWFVSDAQVTKVAQKTSRPSAYIWGVSFEGSREAVEWQLQQLPTELTPDDRRVLETRRCEGLPPTGDSQPMSQPLRFQMTMTPSGLPAACAAIYPFPNVVVEGSIEGTVHGFAHSTQADAPRLIDAMLQATQPYAGNVVIRRCPTEWKSSLPIWGRPPAALAVMNGVKRALDPKGLFNPGRFVTEV